MVECNSYETHNTYPNLSNQQNFRLKKMQLKIIFSLRLKKNNSSAKDLVNTLLLLTILISH